MSKNVPNVDTADFITETSTIFIRQPGTADGTLQSREHN